MKEEEIKRLPVEDLQREDAIAGLKGGDVSPQLEAIAELPLEKRYVWRVASALKWGFADFDSASVAADRDALLADDFLKCCNLSNSVLFSSAFFWPPLSVRKKWNGS